MKLLIGDGATRGDKKGQQTVQPSVFALVKQRKAGYLALFQSHTDRAGLVVQEEARVQTTRV